MSETPMLRNHYFSGFFLRPKCDILLPKLLTVGVVCDTSLVNRFNCFMEFSHLGVNNSWVWVNLLSLGTYRCWKIFVANFISRIYIVVSMLRNKAYLLNCNFHVEEQAYLLWLYVIVIYYTNVDFFTENRFEGFFTMSDLILLSLVSNVQQ